MNSVLGPYRIIGPNVLDVCLIAQQRPHSGRPRGRGISFNTTQCLLLVSLSLCTPEKHESNGFNNCACDKQVNFAADGSVH